MPKYELGDYKVDHDSEGNPICKRCGDGITKEGLQKVWFYPEKPDKPFGPFCHSCLPLFKLCSHCDGAFSLSSSDNPAIEDEITFCGGDGIWLCHSCKDKAVTCEHCESIMAKGDWDKYVVQGKHLCPYCHESKTFTCNTCGDRHLETDKASKKVGEETYHKWYRVIESLGNDSICYKCFNKGKRKVEPYTVIRCGVCNQVGQGDPAVGYCTSCIRNRRVVKCEVCKKYHHSYNTYPGDTYVCSGCESTHFFCHNCRSLKKQLESHNSAAAFRGTSVQLCKDCMDGESTACPTCLSLCSTSDVKTRRIKGKGVVKTCPSCDSKLSYCSDCKDWHMGESSCRPNTWILNYTYKPYVIPNYRESDLGGDTPLFLGIENEISFSSGETRDKAMKHITNKFSSTEVYCKSDSSIRGAGFEVVTHPYTLEAFHTTNFKPIFKFNPDIASSCGMHVHVSRSFFIDKLHICKFITFINDWDELRVKVAGRDSTGYSEKIKEKIEDVVDKKAHVGRCSFVNLNPTSTMEVRIFQGAVSIFEFRYKLEFTAAMANFSKGAKLKSKPADFLQYLTSNKGLFPNLYTYLIKNNNGAM